MLELCTDFFSQNPDVCWGHTSVWYVAVSDLSSGCWSSSSLKLRPSKNKEPIIQLEMFVQDKRVRLDLTRQFLNIQLLNLLCHEELTGAVLHHARGYRCVLALVLMRSTWPVQKKKKKKNEGCSAFRFAFVNRFPWQFLLITWTDSCYILWSYVARPASWLAAAFGEVSTLTSDRVNIKRFLWFQQGLAVSSRPWMIVLFLCSLGKLNNIEL